MSVTSESGGALTSEDMVEAVTYVQSLFPGNLVAATGSVYICGCGHDLDVLVLESTSIARPVLLGNGFVQCGSTEYVDSINSGWTAMRNGDVNVIIVEDMGLWLRWKAAAEVCRALQLTDKRWRIAIHEMIKNYRTVEEAWTVALNA